MVCSLLSLDRQLSLILIGLARLGVGCASQDIAIDALAIGLLDPAERVVGNAVQGVGGSLGKMIGGSAMLMGNSMGLLGYFKIFLQLCQQLNMGLWLWPHPTACAMWQCQPCIFLTGMVSTTAFTIRMDNSRLETAGTDCSRHH